MGTMDEQGDIEVPVEYRRPSGGIFITRGMTVGLPPDFQISIDPDGEVCTPPLNLHVLIDMCPYWLEIALDHLSASESRHVEVLRAIQTPDDERLNAALEAEFTSCMQGTTAAAIAIDSFYAAVKKHIVVPKETTRIWRENNLARYKQIAEVMRLAFRLKDEELRRLRETLKLLFDWRDMAVHPSADLQEAVWHPDISLATEWRFTCFRLHNALCLTKAAMIIVAQLTPRPAPKFPNLVSYCEAATVRIAPLVGRWETQYGFLYERPDTGGGSGLANVLA